MKAAKDKYQFVIFGGTWCEDTQFILPKFFKLQEDAGIADSKISFFGVNREKQTLGNMAAAFKVTNVPTIIVMKDGAEVGRVVEYGKTGKWDKELADLLK
jgi:thiol-disulfide isomerase/thioredoxin